MLLLFAAGILYNIDRAIVGVLAEPIRGAFAISDVQMGLLLGLAIACRAACLDSRSAPCSIDMSERSWRAASSCGAFFVSRTLVGLGESALAAHGIAPAGRLT